MQGLGGAAVTCCACLWQAASPSNHAGGAAAALDGTGTCDAAGLSAAQCIHPPAADFDSKAAYQAVHGSDLFITDVEKYDLICKVSDELGVRVGAGSNLALRPWDGIRMVHVA